ncbi:MAG: preprotein translocase subunit SecA, partial [Bacteroidota bacterium]
MLDFFKNLFGSKHERDVQSLWPVVAEINAFTETLQGLTDDELKAKTPEFRQRIDEATAEIKDEIAKLQERLKEDIPFSEREGIYNELDELNKHLDATIRETLDEILPEAFAVVKETCRRLVGQSWDVAGNKTIWDMVP